jgi:uncharacterized protein YfaS (alpha-2-macroglobulin family)
MKRNACLLALAAIFILLAGCGKPEEQQQLKVNFDRWVVMGEDVHFAFTLPMVAADKLQTAPAPSITFDPPLKGTFAWVSPTEAVFVPEKDEIKYGVNYSVHIAKAVPLLGDRFKIESDTIGEFVGRYFEMAGKAANWPVSRGNPRLVDFLGWHTGEIGSAPLLLLYDQPIQPAKLANLALVTHDGRRLAVELASPTSDQISFNDQLNGDYIVSVKITNLPEPGETILVKAPSWQEGAGIEYREWDFRLNTRFTFDLSEASGWEKARDTYDGEGPVSDKGGDAAGFTDRFRKTWRLAFNNPVEYGDVQASLAIESGSEGPVNVSLSGYDYTGFAITVTAPPGVKFGLSLKDGLTDRLGNTLTGKLDLKSASPDLPPELYLPRSPLVVESKGNTLPVKFMNIAKLKVNYQKIASAADYIRMVNKSLDNVSLQNARTKVIALSGEEYPLNAYHQVDIPLETVSPFQLVSIEAQETGSEARDFRVNKLLVHSSDIGITSKITDGGVFVWVTALAAPAALKAAAVTLYDDAGRVLATATTDAFGTALLKAGEDALGQTLAVTAQYGKGMGFSQLVEKELASAWQFRLPDQAKEDRLKAVIFSDRGVYRSGDTVHLKMIAEKQALDSNLLTVIIRDSRGREAYNATLPLDEFSSTACDFAVKASAPTGEYSVYASQGGGKTVYSFQVEEYRTPTFVVNVSGLKDEWKNDERNYGRIKAEYSKGGLLAGRAVAWRVYRQRVPFTVKKLPGYVFGLETGDELNGNVADGEGTLNDAGELALDFSISTPVTDSLMLYVLQGTVTDQDRQAYSGGYSAIVHPGTLYAGVKPPARDIVSSGDDVIVPVIVTDRKGNPVPGVTVKMTVEEISYHSNVRLVGFKMAQMDTREELSDFETATVTSQKAPVQCRLNIPQAGYYRIVFSVDDNAKRTMRTGFTLTVSGDNPTAWPRFDKEQIELLTDKDRYSEGDTATLVTMSPYKKALGLLTLEKGGAIVYKKIFNIDNNTPTIQFAVKAEYAPNVYASVVILRGREHFEKDATGFETGAPGFKIGYSRIEVDPAARRLALSVETVGKNFHPGENVTVSLTCLDKARQPVRGQVTLAVVDEAVLSLTGFRTPDPLTQLLSVSPLAVRTGSNLLDLPHSRRSRHETLFEGGGDDLSGYIEPGKVLRNLFMSTAYWNPAVLLNAQGKAIVQFKLPDNITSYRIMAVVTDVDQRMGSVQDRITSKKPLLVMPVLPRFVYPGDRFTAEARVFNETGAAANVTVKTVLKGAQLESGKADVTGTVADNGQEFFRFPVKVTGPYQIAVRFSVAAGNFTDQAEYTVPVLTPITGRKFVRGQIVPGGKDGTLTFDLPASYQSGSLGFELTASSSSLNELKDAVQFIMQYPHGCIEQTTSNAYPLIILKDLLKDIGVTVDQTKLREYTDAGIARILTFLTSGGGLSYWPGEGEPHPYGTGFGAMALVEARRQGYAVPQEALDKLGDYMTRILSRTAVKKGGATYSDTEADTLALYAAVLGRMGRNPAGFINILWSNNDKLSAFGLAFLAVAVKESNGSRDLLAGIMQLIKTKIVEHEDEAYISDSKSGGGYSLGSDIRSQGAVLYALAASGFDDRLATKLLTGLLKRRSSGGFWGNTQSTIFGIMGIYQYAIASASGAGPELDVTLNNRPVPSSRFTALNSRAFTVSLTEADLASPDKKLVCKTVNRGTRPAFISARLIYHVLLDSAATAASSNGFTITRTYENQDGGALDPGSIPLGALVLVRLKVKSAEKHYYCAVDDQLPAGLEPLNARLKTTERMDEKELSSVAQKTMESISYSEIRDSRVFFYVNEMDAGEYEFVYYARATTAGTFLAPADRIEPMYDPDKFGTTRTEYVTVKK